MRLPAIEPPRKTEPAPNQQRESRDGFNNLSDLERDSWELFRPWNEHEKARFGGGTPAPAIPRSQRQYDGDNCFDYCEVLVLR